MSGRPGAGPPALPYRPGERSQFLASMLAELARTNTGGGKPFGLRTQALSDPTVALLDAWATVADVIAFYDERIATEGFLRTATQPGSLLAIAQLTGYRPRPGLAASVWLAYSLQPDPADTAVVLPAGLLAQSVPGAGELPQTFETTAELVARPSWNLLPVRATGLVSAEHDLSAISRLAVQGAATGLAAGDVLLLSDGNATPVPMLVQAVSVDLVAQVTSVTLQDTQPAAAQPPGPGTPISTAIDRLISGLTKLPATPPSSAADLNRSPADVFADDSDAVPRLVAALNPAIASTLYKALATTTIGAPAVQTVQALQVSATPFGVRMPPKPIFGSQGQQIGTQEWPIAGQQILSAQVSWAEGNLQQISQVSMQGRATAFARIESLPVGSPPANYPGLGQISAVHPDGVSSRITLTFRPDPGSGLTAVDVTLGLQGDAVVVTSGNGGDVTFTVLLSTPGDVLTAGSRTIAISVQPTAGRLARGTGVLVVTVTEAQPPAELNVLDLDAVYPGIVPLSWVAIKYPRPREGQESPWLIAQVTKVETATVARYGMSGTVTKLTLDQNWIDHEDRLLSAIRPVTVHAQPAGLTLLPVRLTGPVRGAAIELDGLYAGLEAGRRIAVTGTRSDLPAGATVPAGEPAMVAGVTQQVSAYGDTPHTVLHLAAQLTYSYNRASVQIHGNVVPAHQGATVTEPLTGAAPGDQHPSYTLSQAPVLADPSATAAGAVSSLQLTVDGRQYTPVTRLDETTPAHHYLTGLDSQGRTTVELSGPLPTGTSIVLATYRAGPGSAGNVRAHQVSQLLSRPLAVAGVDNPLPGSGGSDGDGPGDLRAGAVNGLACLGRLVSVSDAADLVRSWAGVGKAHAVSATTSGGEVVAVTVAGTESVPLDPAGGLCTDLAAALSAAGDPNAPVVVLPARLYLILLAAEVRCAPSYDWAGVSADLRGALVGAFGYTQRRLDEDIIVSDVVAVAHSVPGVVSFTPTAIALVPATADAGKIQSLTASLPAPPAGGRLPLPPDSNTPPAAAAAYLPDGESDALILQRRTGND